jgi:hypothetical protein
MTIKINAARPRAAVAAVLSFLAAVPAAHASCGAAFCPVDTGWNIQGAWTEPGTRVDLRYEYIDQDRPRHHAKSVSVGQLPQHHDEVQTVNHNIVAGVDHTFDKTWSASVSLPIAIRDHEHIHNHHGAALDESWNFARPGDLRVLGRYRLALESADPTTTQGVGVIFGLKLPTGSTGVANDEGDTAERSLQPGTGTLDGVLGAFYQQSLAEYRLSWFAQVLYQRAFQSHNDYRPGERITLDLGARYDLTDRFGLLLQINAHYRAADGGAEAEPNNSGSRAVSVSPGFSYGVTDNTQVYGFIQKPVYQWVKGVQLTADWSAVFGVGMRF